MARLFAVSLAPFFLEDDDLFGPVLSKDLPYDFHVGEHGLAGQDVFPFGIEKDVLHLHRVSLLAGDLFDLNGIPGRNFELFPACTNNRVHVTPRYSFDNTPPSSPVGEEGGEKFNISC